MFGLKFEGPQADVDRFITTLKENPAVQSVYNDSIVTTQQTTKQVIPKNIDLWMQIKVLQSQEMVAVQ